MQYLLLDDILEIHDDLIERYGGSYGIRDISLIESALARPKCGYYSGVIKQASVLWESLSQNHPFIDGNKRTAYASMYVFLAINDVGICATSSQAFDFIINMYQKDAFSACNLEIWINKHIN